MGVELLGEFVDTLNFKFTSVSNDVAGRGDLIAGQIVISDEGLAWLVHVETVWEFLSTEKQCKGVSSVVGVVDLTDLNGIVSQVVMDNKRKTIIFGEETQNLSVFIQKLLLRGNLAATKALFKELLHLRVSLWRYFDQGRCKVVNWALLRWGKWASLVLK